MCDWWSSPNWLRMVRASARWIIGEIDGKKFHKDPGKSWEKNRHGSIKRGEKKRRILERIEILLGTAFPSQRRLLTRLIRVDCPNLPSPYATIYSFLSIWHNFLRLDSRSLEEQQRHRLIGGSREREELRGFDFLPWEVVSLAFLMSNERLL